MSNDFRTQIYDTLKLKETDELMKIWKKNDHVERSELAFDEIREILQQRLGEIPPQDEAVYKHIKQVEQDPDEVDTISPEEETFYAFEESGATIEFEGLYDEQSLWQKAILMGKPSGKYWILRVIIIPLFLVAILIPLSLSIVRREAYFSRDSYPVLFILLVLYGILLHPFLAPYFRAKLSRDTSKVYKGIISSQGLRFISPKGFVTIPWGKIYKAKKSEDLIVIFAEYISPISFPRNFFKSDADWQQFGNWVDYYVKEA